jgi:hypothetical protein
MGKSPWSKNFEFGAKDPGVKSLSFGPQILSLGPPNFEFGAPKNGQIFFAFKKRITDRISHAAGFSVFLNIINTQHDA